MDALMAGLVLGALCQFGDRTPWLAAILADRFRAPGMVIAAAALALALNYALGVVGGLLLAPLMTPEAKQVMLGLALVLAAFGTAWRHRSPDRLEGWRLGTFATSALGLAIMAFGDRMQFIVVALAARSPLPWMAAVGATLGALTVVAGAALAGERSWLSLPHRALQIGTAGVLAVAGLWIGLAGAGLV